MGLLQSVLTGLGTLGQVSRSQPVTLGAITLTGVEVPSVLAIGGDQAMAVKKLPGGDQIVQAMGDDPSNLTLAGTFTGASALSRAQAVQQMRRAGQAVTLSAAGQRFQVLVASYVWSYAQRGNVIAYSLTLKVLPQTAVAAVDTGQTLAGLVGPDIAGAVSMVSTTAAQVASIAQNAVGLVQGAVSQVGPVASLVGLGAPFAHVSDQLAQAQGIATAGTNLAAAPAAAASLLGNLRDAAIGLGGIVGSSGMALGQIGAAAPAGSLLPADPSQVVAATGHALAQAGGVTALASVNRAIVGVQSAAGGAVAWPGSIGG